MSLNQEKFKWNIKLEKRSVVIIVAVAVGIALYLFFVTASAPEIAFTSETMKIKGYYGVTIEKQNISEISLLETAPEFTLRTDGARFGDFVRGYFLTDEFGRALAFGNVKSENWLDIQLRYGERDAHILLGFSNNDAAAASCAEIDAWRAQ